MLRFVKPRTLPFLGVGVLALAMMQGQQVQAQFAWSPRFEIASDDLGSGFWSTENGVMNTVSFVQATPGTYGTIGNYELVVGLRTGGLAHFYRDNDTSGNPWNGPFPFATNQGACDGVSLIQSRYSTEFQTTGTQGPGNLAVVADFSGTLYYIEREDVTFTWSTSPVTITTGVYGIPSFIQAKPGTYGTTGNYELVTPLTTGGLAHYYRNNDNPSLPWIFGATFGTEWGIFDAASVIQTRYSTAAQTGVTPNPSTGVGGGNLGVVARAGDDCFYFEREDVTFTWSQPFDICDQAFGGPCIIQAKPGTYGTIGNFEVIIPSRLGGIAHFYRDNDNGEVWNGPTATFGLELGIWQGTSLIQSSFSSELQNTGTQGPGNLAVTGVSCNELDYWFRADY